jgi:hypothetical protein
LDPFQFHTDMIAIVSLFLNVSAAFAVFSVLFAKFYPRLLLVECVAISFPIGLTLSAWCGLLVKSLLPTGCVQHVVLVHTVVSHGCNIVLGRDCRQRLCLCAL